MISKALTFRILLPRLSATGFAVQVHDRKTKNMLDNTDYDGQNVVQHSVQRAHALRAVSFFGSELVPIKWCCLVPLIKCYPDQSGKASPTYIPV